MSFYIKRFSGVERQTYEAEIVTPMFLGAADPEQAELRAPSIKGMLRFWWRAICGIEKLDEIKEKEGDIFGSTDKKSSFSISVNVSGRIKTESTLDGYKKLSKIFYVFHDNEQVKLNILDYLSYGTYENNRSNKDEYKKKHILPNTKFNIIFCFYNDKYRDEIIKSFRYLLSFSGIGAKNRNGFGSIYSDKTENILDISDLKKNDLKNFSAFSERTELFDKFPERDSWESAISDVGLAYREARLSIENRHCYDKRKLISAPLQVDKKNKAYEERHSKPYFLKVRKLKNGKFKGIILYMPYKYHYDKKFDDYISACNSLNEKL